MRIIKALAAAGLALSAVAMGSAAQAQDYDHGRYDHRRDYRGDRYDHDRGRHNGWNRGYGFRDHRHCWTEWRHHRRVTICR
jgi:hypothetical protein